MNEALDLLSHELATRDVAEVHARAMQALVAELRRKKRAATERPRTNATRRERNDAIRDADDATYGADDATCGADDATYDVDDATCGADDATYGADDATCGADDATYDVDDATRNRTTVVRRQVWTRDAARCCYVDDEGRRCSESARLELHYRVPFARGGSHAAENLELRCPLHNDLAAEHDFAREHIARMTGELSTVDPRQRGSNRNAGRIMPGSHASVPDPCDQPLTRDDERARHVRTCDAGPEPPRFLDQSAG